MKSMAKAILFGGAILAAQAAMADGPAYVNRADGIFLPPRVTYADQHSQDGLATAEPAQAAPAFVNRADGIFLPVRATFADQHANDRVATVESAQAAPAFVYRADGIFLPARATFADTHLDRPMQASRPEQGTSSDAN